jgi:hypothetical protein
MYMRDSLTLLLLLSAYILSPALAIGQIVIDNIDDFHGAPNVLNCTSTKQSVTPPGWEWNCDPGAGNCSSTSTAICGKSSLESTIQRDGQAREMDVSWNYSTGVTHGGMLFHAAINSAANGNLDATDTTFSWGGWFYYTALSGTNWSINQLEFDLNQVSARLREMARIPRISLADRTGEVSHFTPWASFVALFSEGLIGSPVSKTPSGECNAISNR